MTSPFSPRMRFSSAIARVMAEEAYYDAYYEAAFDAALTEYDWLFLEELSKAFTTPSSPKPLRG